VSGRPILAFAVSTDNDGAFVWDQSIVTGAEHNNPVATTRPSALSFFMMLLHHTLGGENRTFAPRYFDLSQTAFHGSATDKRFFREMLAI
jgi:hypothetical protein